MAKNGETAVTRLRYGNTNTWLVGPLLVDTDMAGSLPALWREEKRQGIAPGAIRWVFVTHYHPDHMGLVGELMQTGVNLLLLEHQVPFVHTSDAIFARENNAAFRPIDARLATVISAAESRAFLSGLGLAGEIIPTKSHSPDGAALVLDDGNAFVGDVEPRGFLGGYAENEPLRADWEALERLGARVIHYGHANEQKI